jgi:DNA-binding HxlR family transcriptional regulator
MPRERSSHELKDEEIAQRAVVLQVLRDDRDERWARAELEREIYDIEPLVISYAVERLRQEGVVHTTGELVWASSCAWHLNELGMVSI